MPQANAGAGSTFKTWATAFTKGILLHGCEHLLRDALGYVRTKPVFPSRFIFAGTGKGDDGRRREPCFFREPLKLVGAQFLVGDGAGVLPVFDCFSKAMAAKCFA
ncbi:MAG: hypothetical protein WJ306_11250 [Ferrovum myxofaciens]